MRKLSLRWQIGLAIAIGVLVIADILVLFPYFQLREMGIRDLEQEMEKAAVDLQTKINADLGSNSGRNNSKVARRPAAAGNA